MMSIRHLAVVATATFAFSIAMAPAAQAATVRQDGSQLRTSASSAHRGQRVPATLQPVFYQALAQDAGPIYDVKSNGCAVLRKLTACFDAQGAHFTGAESVSLRLVAFGRNGSLTEVNAAEPTIRGSEVGYEHDNLTEWWRVLPIGFEHGFTIAKRPAGMGKLTLSLSASSKSEQKNKALAWNELRYGKLVVTDAKGNVVPSTLRSEGHRILIAVNDAHATYPLTVDPLVWIEQKVTASDGTENEAFGFPVVLEGDTALVSAIRAPYDVANQASGPGAVYVFKKSGGTWQQVAKLMSSDGVAGDDFGRWAALDGDTALIGATCAPYDPFTQACGPGAVYVFKKVAQGQWQQEAKLTANDGAADDLFGYSIATNGTIAIIGAACKPYSALVQRCGSGAAYVFKKGINGWSQVQKLTAGNGNRVTLSFGYSAALDGTIVLISTPVRFDTNSQAILPGAVYVYEESGGHLTQVTMLTASDAGTGTNNNFGASVALEGTTAIIGAPLARVGGHTPGAAYVFTDTGGTWSQTQKLTASDGMSGDGFGFGVALEGATALVGAYCSHVDDATNSCGPGAAYVFTEVGGTWSQAQKLVASDRAEEDNFGFFAIALSGSTALVGADLADINGHVDQGAAYFYGVSDLGLVVSAPSSVVRNQEFISQTIVTNNSSVVSPAVSATITVPEEASFVSANASQGSCSEAAGVVNCDFGQISGNAGKATANLTFEVTGSSGGTIHNAASIARATPPLTASATIQITNTVPVAQDGTLTTTEGVSANGTLMASDAEGDSLTFSVVSQAVHGTVSLDDATTGAYTYTPDSGYSGSDAFTFKANDGQADSNTATISITVKASGGGGGDGGSGASNGSGGGGSFGLFVLFGLSGVAFIGFGLRRRHN